MKVPIEQFDDVYLLRFLRARKFDLEKTIKMWNDFIDWRFKHNIDNYHVTYDLMEEIQIPWTSSIAQDVPTWLP